MPSLGGSGGQGLGLLVHLLREQAEAAAEGAAGADSIFFATFEGKFIFENVFRHRKMEEEEAPGAGGGATPPTPTAAAAAEGAAAAVPHTAAAPASCGALARCSGAARASPTLTRRTSTTRRPSPSATSTGSQSRGPRSERGKVLSKEKFVVASCVAFHVSERRCTALNRANK